MPPDSHEPHESFSIADTTNGAYNAPKARGRTNDDVTPSVQCHYNPFFPTTGYSAPVPRIGTLSLMGVTHSEFSLNIEATGSQVPRNSLSQGHATFMPDAAWAVNR